jgi:SAM-dependent methyltransferase
VIAHAGVAQPSDWLLRWQHLLQPGQSALDLACGSGRHTRWLAGQGLQVTAVDRDPVALASLSGIDTLTTLQADLEGKPWPLDGQRFDLVLVTNYLWRPLFARIVEALAPGGLLIYETFALGQESVGRPSRAEFLLAPGELLGRTQPALQVLGYEDGWLADGGLRRVQRIAARRPLQPGASAADDWPQSLHLPTALATR